MQHMNFKIDKIKSVKGLDIFTGETLIEWTPQEDSLAKLPTGGITHFDLSLDDKYCIHCAAENTCAMSRLFSYAGRCERYPHGPGFTRENEEYQTQIKLLYNALKDENSELNKQLKQLQKTAKLEK